MRPPMKSTPSTNKQQPRTSVRRVAVAERRTDVERAITGDRREVERRGVARSMVDALSDILQWERDSERRLPISKLSS